jgi:sulfoxide reductase catalytic subunit YedY
VIKKSPNGDYASPHETVRFHLKEGDPGMATTSEERINRDHKPGKGFVEGVSPTVDMGLGWFRLGSHVYPVTLLAVPVIVGGIAAIGGVTVLRATPGWQAFAVASPCVLSLANVPTDYPLWLRSLHYFNILILTLLFRSGIQILADHPRLYLSNHSTPGKEWLRFRGPVPRDRVWTAKDDSVSLPQALGLPGDRHVIGLARKWHFLDVLLWLAIGVAFVILLFATGQWRRLVPTTTAVVPGAVTCAVTLASLHLPPGAGEVNINALQQLAYFSVIFIAPPLSVLTGLAMSPALVNHYGRYQKLFGNRQIARSIHFLLWFYYLVFTIVHTALVVITNFRGNQNRIVLGIDNSTSWDGVIVGTAGVLVVIALNVVANRATWRYPRQLLRVYQRTVGTVMGALFDRLTPDHQFLRADISPYFWLNGKLPTSDEFARLREDDFRAYRLRVYGEVENPVELSLDEIKAMGKFQQITLHNCIQGWSGIAEWGGVQMSSLMGLVRPHPAAKYAIFYSFGEGGGGGQYYDAHEVRELRHPTSILAYEMNDETLSVPHGAPLRLRNESQLGFKMVKWVRAIEFVSDYRLRFAGEGGYNEDHEYFGCKAEI